MRIAIASDHGGYRMKNILKQYLATELQIEIVDDFGPYDSNSVDYPDFAVMVARSVANGSYDIGIMLDGVGIGSTMAANKVPKESFVLIAGMTLRLTMLVSTIMQTCFVSARKLLAIVWPRQL